MLAHTGIAGITVLLLTAAAVSPTSALSAPPAAGAFVKIPALWGDVWMPVSLDAWSQASIDAGNVVNWNGCEPSECSVWLAGHRAQHGSVFAEVPDLEVGDDVFYVLDGTEHHYRIVDDAEIVGAYGEFWEPTAELVLTTSTPDGRCYAVDAAPVPPER